MLTMTTQEDIMRNRIRLSMSSEKCPKSLRHLDIQLHSPVNLFGLMTTVPYWTQASFGMRYTSRHIP